MTPVIAAAEESGNFLVSPSVGLMIWLLLAFFVTLFILRKYAFPAIADALDKRQRAIEESIDAAERTREEADQLLAEYRQRLTDARAQADEIVARAERAGEVAKEESLAAAKTQREDLHEQTLREIEAAKRAAIQDIRREVADLTVMATERVTRKTLDESDQRRLVEEALGELDFSALSGGEGSRN
ncbi:MAG: F0F1 ATP synthase subunit B [Conexibacter sp.]